MDSINSAYEERSQRVHDAIELRQPGRVPILPAWQLLPTRYAGMINAEAYHDVDGFFRANERAILAYEPDMYYIDEVVTAPGRALKALDTRQLQWPGHGIGPNQSLQYVEGEYMLAEEYDMFLLDPSGFAMNKYLPRIFGAL